MAFSGNLRNVLLCLLALSMRGTEAAAVDKDSLSSILEYIDERYWIGGQFVLAINVDQRLCEKNFNPEDIKGFFNKYEPEDVVKSMNSDKYIYIGEQMIGATRKKDGHGHEYHSEYLLLNPEDPDQSPMRKLLNKNKEGCVIFYSYLSPCLSTCLNPNSKERNIRCALDMFINHRGPKAFVFRKLFKKDFEKTDKEFFKGYNLLNTKVPLYRCTYVKGWTECTMCFTQNNELRNICLPPLPDKP